MTDWRLAASASQHFGCHMANDEHVAILKKGVDAWNKWRRQNVQLIRPDLATANLSGADLSGANLDAANLLGVDLTENDSVR